MVRLFDHCYVNLSGGEGSSHPKDNGFINHVRNLQCQDEANLVYLKNNLNYLNKDEALKLPQNILWVLKTYEIISHHFIRFIP